MGRQARWCCLLAACLLVSSCDSGGDIRAAGPPEPSHATLEEAKQIDEAQQLVDDGLFDQARAKLDVLFQHGCRHPQALMLEAKLAYRQGDFDQVIPWCDRALEASPLWVEPRVLMAQSYLKLKRYAAAASAFEDIDRIAPDSPWGPYGMGVVAAMRMDADGATRELDRALARDPKHAPSLEARASVARMRQERALEEKLLQRYVVEEPLDAFAFERLGELARAADRREDARRAFERAFELARLPESAKQLAELARQRGDAADERLWSGRAGLAQRPASEEPATPK